MKYQFDWNAAFSQAFDGERKLLDTHIKMARVEVLIPVLLKKTGRQDDADEIASMVITKFWERFYIKEENLPSNVNGYLYTMANNAFFHYTKKKEKETKQYVNLDIGDMNRVFDSGVENITAHMDGNISDKERLLLILESSFGQLGDKCRNLLKMFIFEKRRMKDIYQDLGFPSANAATKKKEGCINKLRKLMYEEIRNQNIEGYDS